MPRAARKISQSGFYHIINRGVSKQLIFEQPSDYRKFLKILKRFSEEEGFEVIAYCLMQNHFHLLIKTDAMPGKIIQKISISYSYYFNKKYGRVGHLFQNRFKSEAIEMDPYFVCAIRYIHNNPLKAGICKAEDYRWSSYHEYVGTPDIIKPDYLLGMIGGKDNFKTFDNGLEKESYLEVSDSFCLSDESASELITKTLGLKSCFEISNFSIKKRNEYIKKLKEIGLGCTQIMRLTGIGRGVIERI